MQRLFIENALVEGDERYRRQSAMLRVKEGRTGEERNVEIERRRNVPNRMNGIGFRAAAVAQWWQNAQSHMSATARRE